MAHMRFPESARSRVSAARRFRSSVQHQNGREVIGGCGAQILLLMVVPDVEGFVDEADAQLSFGGHRGIF